PADRDVALGVRQRRPRPRPRADSRPQRTPPRPAGRLRLHSAPTQARARPSAKRTRYERSSTMVTKGLIARLEAKAGKEDEVAAFLRDALPIVQGEQQTVAWLALRASESSFAIVDVFPDEAGRRAHLDGAVAAALIEAAGKLLAAPPEI